MELHISINEIREKFNLPENVKIVIDDSSTKDLPCVFQKWLNLYGINQEEKIRSLYPRLAKYSSQNITQDIQEIIENPNYSTETKESEIKEIFKSRDLNSSKFMDMLESL